MRHAKDKTGHHDKMLDAAIIIQAQVDAGEEVPELALITEHKAEFYRKVFEFAPMPKKTFSTGDRWWTFNAELAEHYELITPFMMVAGLAHGLMTYPITTGNKTESKSMKLMGVNDDGMLIALEILNLTGGTVEEETCNLKDMITIREKFQARQGQPVINDAAQLFKGLKKGPDS